MTNATYGTLPAGNQPSKAALWIGRVLSALPVLMLVFSAVMKFMKPPAVLEGFGERAAARAGSGRAETLVAANAHRALAL